MELSGFAALPFCLLLLALYTAQQFRSWPADALVAGREGYVFRDYCFGCVRRYYLCAALYFLSNALFYLILLGAAWTLGLGGGAAPWLMLIVALVVPALPGARHLRNRLRYALQRAVFRPALPSPAEARLWRELWRRHRGAAEPVDARYWSELLALAERLEWMLHRSGRRGRDDLAELIGVVRAKAAAMQRHGFRNPELVEPLLGCCYLAVARLLVRGSPFWSRRRARLSELELPLALPR